MYQLGLTGGIGSGKTLVCTIFEKLGVPVYYADNEARRLMNSNGELRGRIIDIFGRDSYSGSSLNRSLLAQKVFGDPALLEKLNALVHPFVRRDYKEWVLDQEGAPYVLEEAAILFESGADRYLNGSILVYAPESIRIHRVMNRDGVDEAHVRQRMKHQMDEEEKKKRADYVLYNDERKMLLPQVVALHKTILNRK